MSFVLNYDGIAKRDRPFPARPWHSRIHRVRWRRGVGLLSATEWQAFASSRGAVELAASILGKGFESGGRDDDRLSARGARDKREGIRGRGRQWRMERTTELDMVINISCQAKGGEWKAASRGHRGCDYSGARRWCDREGDL